MNDMQATTIFERFNNVNVLIIGDVMIDRYLTGNVSRVSPEAPVPVVRYVAEENRLGGAANVALNIKAMGAKPWLISVIGGDENGKNFLNLLPEQGIGSNSMVISSARQTTVKTRVIAQNQHLLRVDREDTFDLNTEEEATLMTKIEAAIASQKIDVIIFQDYNKGVLSPAVIQHTIKLAQQQNIPTVVDPKFHNFWAFRGVTLFKPNLREMQDQLDDQQLSPTLPSLIEAAAAVRKKLKNSYTVITLSEKGIFVGTEKDGKILPTQARNIADVCGAGDSVVSICALGLALGMNIETIAFLANLAGGQVCEKVGVVPINKTQLLSEFRAVSST